jgi:hypothetical protein
MPQLSNPRALSADKTLTAIGLAHRCIDAWLADGARSAAAQRARGLEALRKHTMMRVQAVLAHELPAAANRRWLCETVRAWAPLEVLFPSGRSRTTCGVTGELARHLALIVKREYGHVAGGLRSSSRASELLRGDAQRLALELEIGGALGPVLDSDAVVEDWLSPYIDMSLAMAEYLHRHAIGLGQVLSDSAVMRYTTGISRTHQSFNAACRRAPEPAATL